MNKAFVNVLQLAIQWAAIACAFWIGPLFGKVTLFLYLIVTSYGIYAAMKEQEAKSKKDARLEQIADIVDTSLKAAQAEGRRPPFPSDLRGRKDVS